jgi:ribosomal protein S18 acetylase RimI-like enzyme
MSDFDEPARLQKRQAKAAAEVLTRAFFDDPLINYFYPDAAERQQRMPYAHRFILNHGIRYGEAYVASARLEGIAVWLPSEGIDMTLRRAIRAGSLPLVFRMGREASNRMRYFGEHMESLHKKLVPRRHWYLQVIGVAPESQGRGYGGRLMKPMLARADREGLPCYLETQNENNVALYRHHGFEVIKELVVPGTAFNNWIMLREPRG